MKLMSRFISVAVLLVASSLPARAAVINAPVVLNNYSGGWVYNGIGFRANRDSVLTHFQYQSYGYGSTIDLIDESGTILHSLPIAGLGYASRESDADVEWSLAAGSQYYLFANFGNSSYNSYNGVAPSNEDITLTDTGIFSQRIEPSLYWAGITGMTYWVGFTHIITSPVAVAIPEPNSLGIFAAGLVSLLMLFPRKGKAVF